MAQIYRRRVRIKLDFQIEMDTADASGGIPPELKLPNQLFMIAGGRALGLPDNTALFGGAKYSISVVRSKKPKEET